MTLFSSNSLQVVLALDKIEHYKIFMYIKHKISK